MPLLLLFYYIYPITYYLYFFIFVTIYGTS
nr:MAG TPA: hypothetical protein [Caudoviricetes sp.]